MYHCHLQLYFVGVPDGISALIQKLPHPEGFSYSFLASGAPEREPASQADVILAKLSDGLLPALTESMKPKAQLILLAEQAGMAGLAEEALSRAADVWLLPMPERELRFRFERWQQGFKRSMDLWQTGQFLEAAMNNTPNLVWFKDKNGIHEKVNDSFCETVGKPKELVEGKTHAFIWDVEEDDPACIESERKVMEGRKRGVSEETVRSGSGLMQLTTYKSPLYDLDGSVMGTVGIAIDVTKETAYREEIREKNRTLERLLFTIDCGMMCHSLDGKRVLTINSAALRLLGYASEEELMKDGFHLVAQSVLDEDKPLLRAAIGSLKNEGDSTSVEYRVRHKDGTLLHILGNVKLVKQEGELYYQRFLLDVTDRQRREAERWAKRDQELRYQEQMFDVFSAFLSDKVDDVYMMMDESAAHTEFITPNVERVLGVSPDAVTAQPFVLGAPKYLTGRPLTVDQLVAMEPGMSVGPMETERFHKKTGETRYFQESVYCVSLQGKKRIIVYISDRTGERKSRDALAEALDMAQVASKAKSSFLSSVSHDIRTPMNAIMGLVELLREEADDPRRVLEYTQKISAASRHLLGLINDVLDMNKIESGSAVLNISEMTIAEIIDELNTIIRPQARNKNQTFEIYAVNLNNEDLLGDKVRIDQIMINILSNAVKYTPVGGRIVMRVEELPQVSRNYSRIRFTISDNGQGMSKEYQKVIFDPFTREKEIVWNQMEGSGLGMSITKRLVDLMGGTIQVESELGKGSTFTLELELRIQKQGEDPEFWTEHKISRMFVADDDEEVCKGIAKKMQDAGVAVDYATSGEKAIEAIHAIRGKGERYDLILMDWQMPGVDGLEASRMIRDHYPDHAPILLFTAYDWADIEREAEQAGVHHFLPKPFFMSNFKDAIRRMAAEGAKAPAGEKGADDRVVAKKKILVVDDIEINRMILVKILTNLGARCDMAVDGQDALDKFTACGQQDAYDIVMMDIQMPRLNGYEATTAIRASGHPAAQSAAIIAMSANAFIDDIRKSLDCGMDAHISKPVVLDQLKQTIREVLDRKKEAAQNTL